MSSQKIRYNIFYLTCEVQLACVFESVCLLPFKKRQDDPWWFIVLEGRCSWKSGPPIPHVWCLLRGAPWECCGFGASVIASASHRGGKIYQVLREPTLSLHPTSLLTQLAKDQKDDKPIFVEGLAAWEVCLEVPSAPFKGRLKVHDACVSTFRGPCASC